jgi:hypothetical protein
MVVYSFLHAKQGRLFSEIDRNAGKLIELLKSRDLKAFDGAYPTNIATDKSPKSKHAAA